MSDSNFVQIQDAFSALPDHERAELLRYSVGLSTNDPRAFPSIFMSAEEVRKAEMAALLGRPDDLRDLQRLAAVCRERIADLTNSNPGLLVIPAGGEAIAEETNKKEPVLGYLSPILIQTTLPRKVTAATPAFYQRSVTKPVTGAPRHTLTISGTHGLPSGGLARLILVWLTTKARNSRKIDVGESAHEFVTKILGLPVRGGKDHGQVYDQLVRLVNTSFTITKYVAGEDEFTNLGVRQGRTIGITSEYNIFWDPGDPHKKNKDKKKSTLEVTDKFQSSLVKGSAPTDMSVLIALRGRPFAMDLYMWLNWANFSICVNQEELKWPWEALMNQFSPDYGKENLWAFRQEWKAALSLVQPHLPEQKWELHDKQGFIIRASPITIKHKRRDGNEYF